MTKRAAPLAALPRWSPPGKAYSAGPAAFFLRRRANTASAPMPNSATIGGSGTLVPELLLVLPLVELEVLVDELVELEVEELVEVLEVTLPEVEVLVETWPEVEVEEPPVLVETLPEVEVEEPPVEVEVELPLTLTITPLLELPEVEPLVLVVELIEM